MAERAAARAGRYASRWEHYVRGGSLALVGVVMLGIAWAPFDRIKPLLIAAGAPKPEETSPGLYRFRLTVESKKTATLAINEVRPLEQTYSVANLDDSQISVFLRQRSINPEVEQALRRIVEQKNRVAALESEIEKCESESQKIFDDQERLRENLKALKGSPEEKALIQRYTRQLDEQENRLEALRKETADLETKRQQAQAELNKMVQDLSLDVNL